MKLTGTGKHGIEKEAILINYRNDDIVISTIETDANSFETAIEFNFSSMFYVLESCSNRNNAIKEHCKIVNTSRDKLEELVSIIY